jgi:hypothetical protein
VRRAPRLLSIAGCLLAVAAAAWGYAFLGSTWPTTTVVMHLQLGASGALMDGSASWNASAENALAAWNENLRNLEFRVVRNSDSGPGDGDGVNDVFFSSAVYGSGFGDAVAVTTEWSVGSRRTEADVLFNAGLDWNSYRGDLRRSSNGGTLYDLHRVALHEFGHVLGLDHPDEHGQSVAAIMNSSVSDVDHLLTDDIRGAQALYGARATGGRAAFTNPTAPRIQTSRAAFTFRGSANPDLATAVFLTNSQSGARRFFKATGLRSWNRRLALLPGRNVISLYVRTPAGTRVKVGQRVVVRL